MHVQVTPAAEVYQLALKKPLGFTLAGEPLSTTTPGTAYPLQHTPIAFSAAWGDQ
jgi:hypothetical protein